MVDAQEYSTAFQDHLESIQIRKEPETLYDPIYYILSLGGKRVRPLLTLLSCDLFGADFKEALDAATAIELFHNFSLIHDDIMDEAPLRRGNTSVHEKWNLNTGILSGDAMLILAYRFFESYDPDRFAEMSRLFSKTALAVCEGQQLDLDFESRERVSLAEYEKMIEYKTAVLLGAAMQMGAIVARTNHSNKKHIFEFGKNLGMAFQIQDDYLDAFGDPDEFGKQLGGDIIANKKTFLYLKTIELGSLEEVNELQSLYNSQPEDPSEKIKRVLAIYSNCGADVATRTHIEHFTLLANSQVDKLNNVSEERTSELLKFGEGLMNRTF